MTKEEKAVEEYAESLKSIAFENLSGEETPYLLRGAFKEGLESANKHWQEKTRWRDLSSEFPPEEKAILFKSTKNVEKVHCRLGFIGLGLILLDRSDSLSEREAKELGTFWKEIE